MRRIVAGIRAGGLETAAIVAVADTGFAIAEETTAAEQSVAGVNELWVAAIAGRGAAELQQSRLGV